MAGQRSDLEPRRRAGRATARSVRAAGRSRPAERPRARSRRKRKRRWPLVLYAIGGLILLLVLWLVITAPLSRALEPLDDPAMLLVSGDGQAIARRGAIKEAPVEVAKLDPLTPAAFVAIEDRRFYRHWGIDPRGIGRAMVANVRAGGVRQGGSTITQQLAKTSFLSSDRSYQAQGAGSDHRLLARSLADQGRNPLALSVERLFRRRRLWACAPPRTIISAATRSSSTSASRRCSPAWSRRRRGWPRPATSAGAQKRSRLVLEAMADTGVISQRARATRDHGARRSPAQRQASDRHLFRRLGRARRATGVRSRLRRDQGADDARPPAAAARRAGGLAARRSAMRRRRWSRCGPTARWSRWSAARVTASRRSTAPPRRGASRDRRSSCSSISPRCAPAGPPTA